MHLTYNQLLLTISSNAMVTVLFSPLLMKMLWAWLVLARSIATEPDQAKKPRPFLRLDQANPECKKLI